MRHYYPLALLAPMLLVAGCGFGGVNGDVTAGQNGASTVNGSIEVPTGLHSGAVGTVNGAIRVEENATVSQASTVNGSIQLGAHSSADSLTAVNGGITLENGARVAHAVNTVNGGVNLHTGADVGGTLGNVNGHIRLTAAHVAGGLHTVSGDIDITGDSRVEDGILVEKPGSGFFNFSFYSHKPRIVIGPGAVVKGDLRFEREVQLYVSDKATVGPIQGAKAISFSGDSPPSG